LARLLEEYRKEVASKLRDRFHYKNVMEIPTLEKISINTSISEALQNIKVLEAAREELGLITGQRPVITRAKKAISNFKIRTGNAIGCRVTLRHLRMWEFYDRFVNIVLPRVRDFKGVPTKSFDGRGNYTLGLTEQMIFPELNPDKVTKVYGMNITFGTTAKTDDEAKELLSLLGMPFRK